MFIKNNSGHRISNIVDILDTFKTIIVTHRKLFRCLNAQEGGMFHALTGEKDDCNVFATAIFCSNGAKKTHI